MMTIARMAVGLTLLLSVAGGSNGIAADKIGIYPLSPRAVWPSDWLAAATVEPGVADTRWRLAN